MTITEFLSAFYPDEDEQIWVLGFPAKKLPDGHPDRELKRKRAITRKSLATNRLVQNNLISDNKNMGIYFVVNAGGTHIDEITRINAVYCEFDDVPIEDQHALYDQMPLKPSIRVETKKSVHAYWLLSDQMTVGQWKNIQCHFIEKYKTDNHLKNPNRVMRLPGFKHVSWDGEYRYKLVTVHTFDPDLRYTSKWLNEAFPYEPPPMPKYEEVQSDETWGSIKNELRNRISLHPTYKVEANRTWATCKGICHDGKNNTAIAVNLRTGAVICQAGCDYFKILNAFGLDKPEKKAGIVRVPVRPQSSKLYEYLLERQR